MKHRAFTGLVAAICSPVLAQEGYKLAPVQHGSECSASVSTPAGTWTLKYWENGSNMQSTCDAELTLKTPSGQTILMAQPSMVESTTAVLSLDLKSISTEEVTLGPKGAQAGAGKYEIKEIKGHGK